MNNIASSIIISLLMVSGVQVQAASQQQTINNRIISKGVPADALNRLNKFIYENRGRSFVQDTYYCDGKPQEDVKPCEEKKRIRSSKTVNMGTPQYVAIIDYSAPSTEERFFFINMRTGAVDKYLATHGIGSGEGAYAYKFSNIKDSRQTSLGIYLAGEVYSGSYGKTLRMYGLQRSNDQAYNRDIVLHGAWYAAKEFISSIDPKTGQPRGRLGLSWGCPALSLSLARKLIPQLQDGGLIFHYHPTLLEESLGGRPIAGKKKK